MKLQKTACALVALIALFSLTACHPRAKEVSKMDEQLTCVYLDAMQLDYYSGQA